MKTILNILLSLLAFHAHAQNRTCELEFVPMFQGEPLIIGKYYFDPIHQDSICITSLKFYVALKDKHEVRYEDKVKLMVYDEENRHLTYHQNLTDISSEPELYLGVDSILNTCGALSGDLDPSLGMYWTWNTGYINVKIEGRSKNCSALKHEFQFHLGGYSGKYKGIRQVSLVAHDMAKCKMAIELGDFFAATDLREKPQVMSPSDEGNRLATLFANTFHLIR